MFSQFTQDYIEMLCTLSVPLIHKKSAEFTINPSDLFAEPSEATHSSMHADYEHEELEENYDDYNDAFVEKISEPGLPHWFTYNVNLQIISNYIEEHGLLSSEILNTLTKDQTIFSKA